MTRPTRSRAATDVGRRAAPRPAVAERERGRLIAAHEAAATFFADQLTAPAAASPREYLIRRGLRDILPSSRQPFDPITNRTGTTPLTLSSGTASWHIGYAPPTWTALTDHLRAAGFTDHELLTAGLTQTTRRETLVDRFRDRLTFGIRDRSGDLVGFIGRAAPNTSAAVPKYLNSPRTPTYDKGAVLFGLAEQHRQLASGAIPVLVEGPLDALAVDLTNAPGRPRLAGVAPCGTALTEHQVQELAQVTRGPVLVAFDSDTAGDRAAAHAHNHLSAAFSDLRAVRTPPNTDPAELLEITGPSNLRRILSRTQPLMDRIVNDVLRRYDDRLDNAEARISALRELAPVIAQAFAGPHTPDRARQAAELTSRLDLDHATVTRELIAATTHTGDRGQETSTARRRRELSTVPPQRRTTSGGLRID